MNKQQTLTGYLLIFSAATFWISWYLMPDQGTTDTSHILTIVKASRINVLCSVTIQIISCILYVFTLLRLAQHAFPLKRTTLTGIALLTIGAMGLCADAFFHLLAYGMTDNDVNIEANVVRVMQFMQTTGVLFLIPLLLAFFIGSLLVAIGLKQQGMVCKVSVVLFIVAIALAITGSAVSKTLHYNMPGLLLMVLGLFALGQMFIGLELTTPGYATKKSYIHVKSSARNFMDE